MWIKEDAIYINLLMAWKISLANMKYLLNMFNLLSRRSCTS